MNDALFAFRDVEDLKDGDDWRWPALSAARHGHAAILALRASSRMLEAIKLYLGDEEFEKILAGGQAMADDPEEGDAFEEWLHAAGDITCNKLMEGGRKRYEEKLRCTLSQKAEGDTNDD